MKTKFKDILAIDMDGVLHDYKHPIEGKRLGPPLPDAVVAMDDLYDRGYKLIIHTVKATTKQGAEMVEEWLDHYGFEYHEITAIKPNATYYIDDRAIRHTGWADTYKQIGIEDED